jgi:effector-binding domain-containing protein
MISEPKVEERAEQPYVAVRTRVPMPNWGHLLPGLWGEVYGWLGRQGVAPTGPPLIRYRVIDMQTELEIDVGVPVAQALTGDDRITADVLPAGRYTKLVYTGDYSGLVGATAALLDWGAAQGLVWDSRTGPRGDEFGARFESYLTDPQEEPDPAKWETALAMRLADGSAP